MVKVDSSFAIDLDSHTIEMWAKQHFTDSVSDHIGPSFFNSGEVFAGRFDVGSKSWYNISRKHVNVFWTKSPPCQSWSLGGRGQGLESWNGLAWVHSIVAAKWLRPNAILVECADTVPSHSHFRLIKASYKLIGYRMHWMKVVAIDQLTSMHRTRWISLWLRNDVVQTDDTCTARLVDPCLVGWDDPLYKFVIPDFLMHQLKITEGLVGFYGNFGMLPPSKKALVGKDALEHEVLLSRCISHGDTMPTLCSSYTNQHHLDHHHLQNKGIFATLVRDQDEFRFLDPIMFLPLLGATCDQIAIVASEASVAFRHLGNAIAVPHALLVALIGIKSCGFGDFPIDELILKCWNDRLSTANSIVIANHDVLILSPCKFVMQVISTFTFPVSLEQGIDVVFDKCYKIKIENRSCEDLLIACGIQSPCEQGISFFTPQGKVDSQTLLDSIAGIRIRCFKQHFRLFEFEVPFELVFPTQPWNVPDPHDDDIDELVLHDVVVAAENMLSVKQDLQQRIEKMALFGPMIGSDELVFVKHFVNVASDTLQMLDPWICGTSFDGVITAIRSKIANGPCTVGCPIYACQHWGAFEVAFYDGLCILNFINFDQRDFSSIKHSIQEKLCASFPISFVGSCIIPVSEGFCGWALVARWLKQCSTDFPCSKPRNCIDEIALAVESSFDGSGHYSLSPCLPHPRQQTCDAKSLRLRQQTCDAKSLRPDVSPLLWIAKKVRHGFFHALSSSHAYRRTDIVFGAAENDDEDMAPAKEQKIDPWLRHDPWQGGKRQCKWEDLTLPSDHPFHDEKGNRVQQTHRHALTPTNPGIAFCTKGAVVDTLAKGLKQPFAFIIPANDKVAFDPSLNLKLSAVHEIVVQDSVLGTVYKRQIVLAQTQNCILFKLPTPEYKATLTEKFELVLEAFTCLLTKESLASFTDKPYDALKARVSEQCPSIAAQHSNLYGFRRIPDQCHKDHFIIQAMCRVTKESRIKLLEMSGAGDVFVRNFVPKEGEKSDVTVIPKFWPSDRSGRDESLRAAGSLEGFAGIISTRRGIAVRAWCAKVACVRKVLLSNDDRINEINIDTIPVDLFDSTGWPANISPGEIVRAVHHSCKLPAIPTRCFRAMGVTTWTLGFEKPPSTLKFTASFNNEVCEILLTKTGTPLKKIVGKQPNAKKNFNHVKADSSKSAVGDSKDENASRITALETRFSAMERRQDGMEERLQTNFDGIQNQLRQLLNAVQPRSASPARTGMTPPTKVPKAS